MVSFFYSKRRSSILDKEKQKTLGEKDQEFFRLIPQSLKTNKGGQPSSHTLIQIQLSQHGDTIGNDNRETV